MEMMSDSSFKRINETRTIEELYSMKKNYEQKVKEYEQIKDQPSPFGEGANMIKYKMFQKYLNVINELIDESENNKRLIEEDFENGLNRLFYGHLGTDFNREYQRKAEAQLIEWCENFKKGEFDYLKFVKGAIKLSYDIEYLNSTALVDFEDRLIYWDNNKQEHSLKVADKLIELIKTEGSDAFEVKIYADDKK